jgi:hypothetical protein
VPRFALLEHTAAPDDSAGRHFDLLLEEGDACRTWRLEAVPKPAGPAVAAVAIAAHRLAWLDHEAGPVSGGRGFARRVDAGSFTIVPRAAEATAAEAVVIDIAGAALAGRLWIEPVADGWTVRLA